MPPWIMKATVQGVMSILPRSQQWNYLFQKYVAKSMPLERNPAIVSTKLDYCRCHLEHYESMTQSGNPPPVVVELGTGWFPIIPVGLYLCGVSHILSFDIVPLLRIENVRQTLKLILEYEEQGLLKPLLPQLQEARLERLVDVLESQIQDPGSLLEELGIEYVLADARNTGLTDSSVNLISSNNTLEHIPREVILGIFYEGRRILAPDGIMSHQVDLADHYSYFDHDISPYNFLRYPDRTWRIFNNRLQYQNRLRASDYLEIHREAGLVVKQEVSERGDVELLTKIPLAERFRRYSQSDLLITGYWIVSASGKP